MSLPSLAPVSALEVRLGVASGSLSGADLARAQACLDDVSALVREAVGRDFVDEIDELTDTIPAAVVTVTVQAALRGYRNPDGLASESIGSGAYAYSFGTDAQAGIYLSAAEVEIVRKAVRGTSGSTYSIGTPSAYGERPPLPDFLTYRGGY
jgi:hypothetical protein